MRALIVCALGTLCMLIATPARGQSSVDLWVEGRYVHDYDKTRDHVICSGPGAGFAVGVDFSRFFGLEVAADWPDDHVQINEMFFQGPRDGQRRVETISSSAPGLSVYATFHLVETTRMRFTLLGGLAWYQTPTDAQVLVEHLGPNSALVAREEYNHHDNYLQRALAFGVELPIRVTRTLSMVPSFHGAWTPLADYGRDGFLRPSIGARWTF
jgi:hypothetical protein